MVRTTPIVPALLVGLALVVAPQAQAAETEVRQFNVSVDGKPSGQYTMTIAKSDDGVTITCEAHVKVKVALITAYHYDFTAIEEWKDGKVQSLRSRCDDDGKKFEITATAGEKGLTVKVNGREKSVRGDVYLTTACCLPDAKRRDGDLPLLEGDNAQEINGKIQQVSSGPMTVCGDSINVTRYRLTSGVAHDVWYDGSDRLVRQEWTEDGHKTVLELSSIKKR
jgi:YD repeat-containing protein